MKTCLAITFGLVAALSWNYPVNAYEAVGDEVQVNVSTSFAQSNPNLARLSDGRMVAVWQDDVGSVKARIYDGDLTPVTGEIAVDDAPLVSAINDTPKVKGLPGGGFIVVWQAYIDETSVFDIYARAFNSLGAAVGAEFPVNQTTVEAQVRPQVEVFNDGRILFAWQHDTGGTWDINYRILESNFTTAGPDLSAAQVTTRQQMRPGLTKLSDGSLLLVWDSDQVATDDFNIIGRRFNAAGPIGDQFMVNTTTVNAQTTPSVAAYKEGGAVIVWHSANQDGQARGIYGQRYTLNPTLNVLEPEEIEFLINNVTDGDQLNASVVSVQTGFVVTWTSQNIGRNSGDADRPTGQDGDGAGIYAKGYTAAGVADGISFRVNVTTSNHQFDPSLTSTAPGIAAVAWASTAQDGDAEGVYMRKITGTLVAPTLSFSSIAPAKFTLKRGKPAPKQRAYIIRNTGSGPLTWQVTGVPKWLKISAPGGVVDPGDSQEVMVRLMHKALPKKGKKPKARLQFAAVGDGTGSALLPVTVSIKR